MDIRKVKKLIELVEESDIAEIEIHEGEESVRISRSGSAAPTLTYALPPGAGMPQNPSAPATAAARFLCGVWQSEQIAPATKPRSVASPWKLSR